MSACTKMSWAVIFGVCTVVGACGCTSKSARKVLSSDPAEVSVTGFDKNAVGEVKIEEDAQWKSITGPRYVYTIKTPPLEFSHVVGYVEKDETEELMWMWESEPLCSGADLDMAALRKKLTAVPDGSTVLIYGYRVYMGDNDSYALHTSKEDEDEARKGKAQEESLHQQLDGVVVSKRLVIVFYDHLMGPIPLSRWDPKELPKRLVSGKLKGLLE